MSFSYDYYMGVGFVGPLIACILFGIISVGFIIKIFNKSSILQNSLWLALFLFALTCNIIRLSYGYKIVLDEKENVATIEGKIEEIEEEIYAPLYKLDGGNSKGHTIYISGEKYYIMSAKDLSINDNVEITYLKNSKFIVEIIVQE